MNIATRLDQLEQADEQRFRAAAAEFAAFWKANCADDARQGRNDAALRALGCDGDVLAFLERHRLTLSPEERAIDDDLEVAVFGLVEQAHDAAAILAHPTTRRLLDLDRPIGVLLLTLLHFVPDDREAYGLVATLRAALPPGSYLALSHANYEAVPAAILAQCEQLYAGTSNPARARTRPAIARFFEGLELAEPGLVYAPRWHPDDPDDPFLDQPGRSLSLVGIARKP